MADEGVVVLGIPIPSSSPLFLGIVAVHVAAGLICTVAGVVAMLSPKRRGRHPSAGTVYYWGLVVVFLTMAALSILRWPADTHLFVLGVLSFSAAVVGRMEQRRRAPVRLRIHVAGMGLSYILLLTAFYVDNGPHLPIWRSMPPLAHWVFPVVIGVPILIWAITRHPLIRWPQGPALALLLLLPALAVAQTSTDTSSPARPLVVTGSSTIYPLMTDIVRRFEHLNPGVSIDVRSGGSGKGIADLRAGVSDIAMVSRQLADNERNLFAFALCQDGAAIVVHRSNTLKGLSRRQLSALLTGNITDWKQLGGRAGAIKLAWRTEQQAIPELLLHHLNLNPEQIRSHTTIFENADAIAFVANDRNAITVAALGVAERSVKSGVAIKLLAYGGIPASTRTVRAHTYLLSRPLILVTRGIPTGLQKQIVDYATSRAVTDLYEKHGFVAYEE